MECLQKYGREYLEEIGRKFNLFFIYKPNPKNFNKKITKYKLKMVLNLIERNQNEPIIRKTLDIISKAQEEIETIKNNSLNFKTGENIQRTGDEMKNRISRMKDEIKKLTGI